MHAIQPFIFLDTHHIDTSKCLYDTIVIRYNLPLITHHHHHHYCRSYIFKYFILFSLTLFLFDKFITDYLENECVSKVRILGTYSSVLNKRIKM